MATQGPLYSGSITTVSTGSESNNDWTNPSNVGADDGSEATITAATYDANDISFRLLASNFGFTIPSGSTIDGITVEIEKRDQNIGNAVDFRVQLLDASGALVGNNKADTVTGWPTNATIITYGGATDTWSASPTVAMVNDVDFGVALSVQATAANTDIFVDFIRVTITYTPPADSRARIAGFELEVPTAPRRARVSGFELEVPTAPRRARISGFEFQVADAPRRARISGFEFEVPEFDRRARISGFELELPDAPTNDRRARLSGFELETPNAARRARVAGFEVEFGTAPRRARISGFELQVGDGPRRARISCFELSVPNVGAGGGGILNFFYNI